MQPNNRYTYENAGFNGFLIRSRKSNGGAVTVADRLTNGSNGNSSIPFDRVQIEGALGDKVTVGRLVLNGVDGRIEVLDETKTTDTGWIGDLTE